METFTLEFSKQEIEAMTHAVSGSVATLETLVRQRPEQKLATEPFLAIYRGLLVKLSEALEE